MSLSLTSNWLKQNLFNYPQQFHSAIHDSIIDILSTFPSLRIKSDVYTYDDGRQHLLLCIHGLLPVIWSRDGKEYRIPINVWLPREFPQERPVVYVVPTGDMLVRAGRDLEVSGRWNGGSWNPQAGEKGDKRLEELMNRMKDAFGREMPVYVKPKQRPGTTSTMSTTTATSVSASPPPRPPPPTTQHGAQHGPVQPPPPLPPSQTSSPLRPPPPPPQPYVSQSPYVSPPPLSPQSTGHPPPPPPPLPPLQPVVSPPPQVFHPPPPPIPTPVQNFLEADPDPTSLPPQPQNAPPRPINPELLHLHAQIHQKLTSELHSLQTSFVLDAERLRGHQTALLEGEKAIRDEMGRLEAVKGVCQTVAGRYRSTIEECERNLGQVKSRWGDQGEVSVDEVICATSIVDDQLITLVAEDNAIEDTIYHLSRALGAGTKGVDLDRFLRATRVLAEEQFMKRALIDKILRGKSIGSFTT